MGGVPGLGGPGGGGMAQQAAAVEARLKVVDGLLKSCETLQEGFQQAFAKSIDLAFKGIA